MRDGRFGFRLLDWAIAVLCLLSVLMLVGLFVPAMNAVRTGPRNQCSTQLKNLGLAAIQHENTKGALPGYVVDFGTWVRGEIPLDPSNPDADPTLLRTHRKIGTWAVALLPWLDAQPTYEHWTFDRYPIAFSGSDAMPLSGGEAGVGFSASAAPNLAIFQCWKSPTLTATHGGNSYVCNSGMYHRNAAGAEVWTVQREGGPVTVDFTRSMSAANGVFNMQVDGLVRGGEPVARGPKVSLDDCRDGQSLTILFTESLQAMPWHRAGFINAGDLVVTEHETEIRFDETSRYVHGAVWHFEDDDAASDAPPVNPVHRINGAPPGIPLESLRMTRANAADLARPSSAHHQGVNAAMADGSTKYLSETIDYRVYQALLTPWGENSDVPEPAFQIAPNALQ